MPEGRFSVVGLRAQFQFGAHVLFWRSPGTKLRNETSKLENFGPSLARNRVSGKGVSLET